MEGSFHRLAIVNRGEAAMRAIRAVRELNETSEHPISPIALYTEPDRQAMFVRVADEAYCLDDGARGDSAEQRSGYLDSAALERALTATAADAAWVGWGFVAERPEFAELCERLGIVFVGPTRGRCGCSATRSRPSGSRSRPACPWRRGVAPGSKPAPKRASRPTASAIRS